MYNTEDTKLITLVKLCKKTKNYKTLAVVSFMLLSNLADEIGIKLGIRARNKESNETIFQYLDLINKIIKANFKILIFKEEMIQKLREIEILFIKMKGNVSLEIVNKAYEIYYDFRVLEIPNLYNQLNTDFFSENKEIKMYSLFSNANNDQSYDKMKNLVLYNLKSKQREIQKHLRNEYNKDLFEQTIYLKKARASLKAEKDGKIIFSGLIKDNITYQKSLEDIYGYFIIGIFFLFLLLGFIVTYQCIIVPSFTASLSFLLLLTYGTSILFFLLYWYNYKKGENKI